MVSDSKKTAAIGTLLNENHFAPSMILVDFTSMIQNVELAVNLSFKPLYVLHIYIS